MPNKLKLTCGQCKYAHEVERSRWNPKTRETERVQLKMCWACSEPFEVEDETPCSLDGGKAITVEEYQKRLKGSLLHGVAPVDTPEKKEPFWKELGFKCEAEVRDYLLNSIRLPHSYIDLTSLNTYDEYIVVVDEHGCPSVVKAEDDEDAERIVAECKEALVKYRAANLYDNQTGPDAYFQDENYIRRMNKLLKQRDKKIEELEAQLDEEYENNREMSKELERLGKPYDEYMKEHINEFETEWKQIAMEQLDTIKELREENKKLKERAEKWQKTIKNLPR